MEASSNTNLRNLVDLLDDTRAFHDEAARSSVSNMRAQHEQKARCYTAMLTEIRRWGNDTQQHGRSRAPGAVTGEPDNNGVSDSYSELMGRIYGMHRADYSITRGQWHSDCAGQGRPPARMDI